MFDVRLQFSLLLICGCLAIFVTEAGSLVLGSIALLLLVCQSHYRLGFNWLLSYSGFVLLRYFIANYMSDTFLNIFLFMLSITLKTLPTVIIASGLAKVPSGKLLASLQKLKIPESILLTFTIALRFFPILRTESKIIGENAKIRGISFKQPKNWLHLQQMFEYAIIPLLMRTIRLADDLSASATTRGIDAPCQKTSHYEIAFRPKDAVGLIVGLSMLSTLWIA
ncbi:energy-coupling factor transporter transmembrane component T [Brevibacillus sp. NRS-1366]|uniref:energy-coupling factor transporter transmembrane component T n=1 Tax=Brevibacillus sp. NRS-1366 TaxID=3233899 RepID=UPI003D1AE47E